jgi:ankyrin repeat protein
VGTLVKMKPAALMILALAFTPYSLALSSNNNLASFLRAVEQNNLVTIRTYLKDSQIINLRDEQGYSALIHASRSERANPKLLKLLLDSRAEVNLQDYEGKTALMHALTPENVCVECIAILLKARADPNVRDREGKTALFYSKHISSTKALIANGAIMDITDNSGFSPLGTCANVCTEEVLEFLQSLGLKPTKSDRLFLGLQEYDLQAVKSALKDGASLEVLLPDNHFTPLLFAVHEFYTSKESRTLDLIRFLLNQGANRNARSPEGATALIMVLSRNDIPEPSMLEALEVLLHHKADPNLSDSYGARRLKLANEVPQSEQAKLLLINYGAQ